MDEWQLVPQGIRCLESGTSAAYRKRTPVYGSGAAAQGLLDRRGRVRVRILERDAGVELTDEEFASWRHRYQVLAEAIAPEDERGRSSLAFGRSTVAHPFLKAWPESRSAKVSALLV
jgi:hypothetical protein